jgi:hypothetical protein
MNFLNLELGLDLQKNIFDNERFQGIKQSLDDRHNLFQKELERVLQNFN